MIRYLAPLLCVLALSACGDDKPSTSISDTTQVYSPAAMDDDDAMLNEPSIDDVASYSRKGTYKTYGTRNGGRQAWRIPKIGRPGQRAIVRFSSGAQYAVIIGKANRTRSGFVFKNGSHGGYYIHAPYRDKSQYVTVYF